VIACMNCKFWLGGEQSGECRRFAPLALTSYNHEELLQIRLRKEGAPEAAIAPPRYRSFPRTDKEDWCGEFEGGFTTHAGPTLLPEEAQPATDKEGP
jgi:hypothetical protein